MFDKFLNSLLYAKWKKNKNKNKKKTSLVTKNLLSNF